MAWHWVFLTETSKRGDKRLSSKISHGKNTLLGNDTLPCKNTVLPGLWASLPCLSAPHIAAQLSPLLSSPGGLSIAGQPNLTVWEAWSNLPFLVKELCNELICRNLPSNFYTKLLLLLLPTQVLRRKWLRERTCPFSWQFVSAANHSCL